MDFDAAADHAMRIIRAILPVPVGEVLNINLPNLDEVCPKGIAVVPQSTNGFEECYLPAGDLPGGSFMLSCGQHRPDEHATDTMMLFQGFITITPLQPDMTNHTRLAQLQKRLGSVGILA